MHPLLLSGHIHKDSSSLHKLYKFFWFPGAIAVFGFFMLLLMTGSLTSNSNQPHATGGFNWAWKKLMWTNFGSPPSYKYFFQF